MNTSSINGVAVAICVLFSVISGSLWFGPKTFFPVWWNALGLEGRTPSGSPTTWALIIGTSVVQAFAMALIVPAVAGESGATLGSGALTGFALWLGFVAPTGLVNKVFPGHLKAWAIETGNHLVNFVAFGAIIGGWR